MACPHGPGGATQRSSVAGTVSDQDELHQGGTHSKEDVTQSSSVKGKVFPYSLPSVGPGADPGVQAVSPQVT